MWDERERIVRVVLRFAAWAIVAVGAASAAASVTMRAPAIAMAFAHWLAFLACFVLAWVTSVWVIIATLRVVPAR